MAQSVDVHRLRGEDYEFAVPLPIDAELASTALPGFRVPVRALFDQAANVAALTALLRGETVTVHGRYVQLAEVALDWPPAVVPPLLVACR